MHRAGIAGWWSSAKAVGVKCNHSVARDINETIDGDWLDEGDEEEGRGKDDVKGFGLHKTQIQSHRLSRWDAQKQGQIWGKMKSLALDTLALRPQGDVHKDNGRHTSSTCAQNMPSHPGKPFMSAVALILWSEVSLFPPSNQDFSLVILPPYEGLKS